MVGFRYVEGGLTQKKKADTQEELKSSDQVDGPDGRNVGNSAAMSREEPWMEWVQSCKYVIGLNKQVGIEFSRLCLIERGKVNIKH